jgi:hypothetical protein
MAVAEERRKRRSTNVVLALTYWLEATVKRFGVEGLTLADADGFLIATNLSPGHAQEVASVAPLLFQPDEIDGRRPVDSVPLPISIVALPCYSGSLLLCALGEAGRREDALAEAATGVRRIIRELVGDAAWGVL